jgi:hypothetical protein
MGRIINTSDAGVCVALLPDIAARHAGLRSASELFSALGELVVRDRMLDRTRPVRVHGTLVRCILVRMADWSCESGDGTMIRRSAC